MTQKRQPPAGTKIDWRNPLTKGLRIAAVPIGGEMREHVTNTASNQSTVDGIVRPYGDKNLVFHCEGTSNYMSDYGDIGDVTGDQITVLSNARSDSGASETDTIVGKGSPYDGEPDAGYQLYHYWNDNPYFAIYTTVAKAGAGPSSFTDSDWHTYTGIYDGSDVWLEVDGVAGAKNSASGNIATTSESFAVGSLNTWQLSYNWFGDIEYVLIWERVLSPAEIASVHENPWQIFKQRTIVGAHELPTDVKFTKLKRPWTRQPKPGARIDWSNPLTKDLLFFAPMDYNGTDAVSGEGATLGSTGPESNIRQVGPSGIWCFDTVGGHGDVSDNGWYYGTSHKNDTWPRGFVNRAQGKPGCTTMSFANIDNAVAWAFLFGTGQQGSPYYDHAALVQQDTTGQWAMQWYWSEGNSDDAGSAGISSILTDGKFHQYAQTIRAGSSGSIGTVYRDGQELGNYGPFGSSNGYFDCDTATDKGIVVHSYAPSIGNDTIGALSYGNAMWARELSATEIKAMYENPWQIFEPQTIIAPMNEELPDLVTFEKDW